MLSAELLEVLRDGVCGGQTSSGEAKPTLITADIVTTDTSHAVVIPDVTQ